MCVCVGVCVKSESGQIALRALLRYTDHGMRNRSWPERMGATLLAGLNCRFDVALHDRRQVWAQAPGTCP